MQDYVGSGKTASTLLVETQAQSISWLVANDSYYGCLNAECAAYTCRSVSAPGSEDKV